MSNLAEVIIAALNEAMFKKCHESAPATRGESTLPLNRFG